MGYSYLIYVMITGTTISKLTEIYETLKTKFTLLQIIFNHIENTDKQLQTSKKRISSLHNKINELKELCEDLN